MKNFKLICLIVLLWLILISTIISAQEFPVTTGNYVSNLGTVAFSGTNFLVGITGDSGNPNSITAQMVSTSGSLIGNRISLGRTGKGPGVIYDGTNYLLVWFDNYNAVYGQFVKTSGNIVGSPFLIAPESAVSGKGNGFAFGDSTFIIVRTKNNIHYAQRVSKSGNLIGTPIQTSMTEAGENAIAFDGKNYLIAFRDQVYDKVIYGQFISESGELVGSNFIIDGGQYVSDNPVSIAFDGSRYLVAFHEQAADNNGWNLFARFVTPSGIVDPNRVTIRDSTYRPGMPQIAFDGTNYFITWVDNFFKPGSLIMGRYFNKAGIPINEAIKIFDSLGGKVPSYGIPTYGNNNFLIVTSRVSATNFTNGDVYGKFIATIPELKIEPYTFDSNTILLDHFDGTTSASILSYIEDYAPCGTVKQSATPNYSYGTGPNGLGQSLSLNAPIGQTSGSATYIKYPGGQLLSLPNGTLEFWVYFTSFGKGTAPFVDQGPYVGSCAGWTYYMTVDSTGQLRAGAWAAFTMTSGSMKIPLKTWTHVATTWGSAGAKLYINGVLVGSDTNTGMPASGYSGSVLMGLLTATGNISSIDELRISNIQRTKFNVGGSVENTQIPNGGFENWSTIGSYENPIGWATMNSVSTGPFYSCTKSTDHYPVSIGNYSIRLENNTSLTQWTGGYGMAVTHAFDYPFKPAFPIVDHPNKLCGYYKYNSMNNDSMFVRIVLFQKGVVVNYFTFITGNSTSTWKSFTLPMTYSSADSATLYFSAFWPNTPTDGPNGNSVLYIDNLSFDNLISSVPLSSSELPSKYSLTQNYPNPFNPTTKIKFGLVERSVVNLVVYDILGREVSTLVNQELDAGYHEVKFNAGNLSSGVYFYQLKSGLFVETKKLTLIK